jgi:dephospho-CoA kinase
MPKPTLSYLFTQAPGKFNFPAKRVARGMIIGLTGGMGCGKTAAAMMFEAAGFERIDADVEVKADILRRPEVVAAIGKHIGADMLADAGREVDRSRLARRVFQDDEALHWLEALVHPLLFAGWRERLRHEPDRDRVFEVPLLFEQGLENWFDFIVCVSTTSAAQLARLDKRGIPPALAAPRISKQLPLAQKVEQSDYVLSNDGTLDFLEAQVAHLIKSVRPAA